MAKNRGDFPYGFLDKISHSIFVERSSLPLLRLSRLHRCPDRKAMLRNSYGLARLYPLIV